MRRLPLLLLLLAPVLLLAAPGLAAERFPPPEFETEYAMPPTHVESGEAATWETIDTVALAAALGLAAWLSLVRRSRRGLVWLGIASLAYFGFWREGCVCAIGATQNVALALFDPAYTLPLPVLLFFFLPLLFALLGGRSFCGAVCPLGAIQDVVLVRPVRVPTGLDHALRLLPHVYLGLAVLLAATGAAFIICEYDPFVAFFRLSGSFNMLVLGGSLLVVGAFVGRPYCRYLCPYGVLLSLTSRLSRSRVRITPDRCVQCRLCEDSCPFGAIELPTPARAPAWRAGARRRLGRLVLAAPLIIAAGAGAGWLAGEPLSRTHPTVRKATIVHASESGADVSEFADELRAFTKEGGEPEPLYAAADEIRGRFRLGGTLLGVWIALVVALKLIHLTLLSRSRDYEADRGSCLSCGRCFEFCPQEHQRRDRLVEVSTR